MDTANTHRPGGQGNGRVVLGEGRVGSILVATVNPVMIMMYLFGSGKTGSRTDLFTVQWPCPDPLRLLLLFCSVSLPPLNITYLLLFAAIYICCDSLVKGIFGLGNMDGIFFPSLRLPRWFNHWLDIGYMMCF